MLTFSTHTARVIVTVVRDSDRKIRIVLRTNHFVGFVTVYCLKINIKDVMLYLHRDRCEKLPEKLAAKSLMHRSTSSLCLLEHGERDNSRGFFKSNPLQYSSWISITLASSRLFV